MIPQFLITMKKEQNTDTFTNHCISGVIQLVKQNTDCWDQELFKYNYYETKKQWQLLEHTVTDPFTKHHPAGWQSYCPLLSTILSPVCEL